MSKSKTDVLEQVLEQDQPEENAPVEMSVPQFNMDEMRANLKQELLADLGMSFLKSTKEKEQEEVKVLEAVVVDPSVSQKPRKIIYEIKALNDENHSYNGAFIAGKVVGKHPFSVNQVVRNTNMTFERENDYYITGLEPEFYENMGLEPEVLANRLREIKIAKAYLEKKYNKSLSPKNFNFWENIRFVVNDIGKVYSTHKITSNANEDHLLLYYVVCGGGLDDISPNIDMAKQWNNIYYLTVREEETVRNFSSTKNALQASSILYEISENWKKEDQLYFLYSLNTNVNHGFHMDTPSEMIVGELKDFIEAKNFKSDKKKKAEDFISQYKAYQQDTDIVKVRGLFNAAVYFGYITTDIKTKEMRNRSTSFVYGSSVDGAITKLLTPINVEELAYIKNKVSEKLNK